MSPEELKVYWAEVQPEVSLQLEYRLHYNELGEITACTMQQHPDSTDYVVVTKDEYDNYFRYCVVKGKLVKIEHDSKYRVRLKKSTKGYPIVAEHAGLVIEADEMYNNVEYYEPNN